MFDLQKLINKHRKSKPNPDKLHFRRDGSFKILQLTDIHYSRNFPADQKTIKLMEMLIEKEKPDLISITGDIATGSNNTSCVEEALGPVVSSGIPWIFQFGNHDAEYGEGHEALLEKLLPLPGCLCYNDPACPSGYSNYHIELFNDDDELRFVFFGLDSNMYCGHKAINGYDCIHRDQIDWFINEMDSLKSRHSDFGVLVFFHIPLPEYNDVWNSSICYGAKNEDVCCPHVNTGMFSAMLEAGHVRGVFVGHDHINDYIGNLYGIELAYGRATGYNTYSAKGYRHGGRIIILKENNTRTFKTYVRLDDGLRHPQHRHKPERK